jgi:hypothetical protein
VSPVPSDAQGHGSLDRARYPDVRERIGEDPAQYLDKPLFETSYDGDCSVAGWTIKVRIQSIDSFAVLGAWKGIERNLDRGPRDRVMEMLNDRAQELEAIGERPDRLVERDGRHVPKSEWYIVRDGERLPWEGVDRATAGAAFSEDRFAVATDGGESDE